MSNEPVPRLLLIGWDGADWHIIQPLLEAGRMPNLARLIEQGTMGQLATLKPTLSPILWSSIATGKRADKHGIFGFIEPKPDGQGVRPVMSTSLRAQPLWNIVESQGLKSATVNWYASHPAGALAGTVVSNMFAQATGATYEGWKFAKASVSPQPLRPEMRRLRVHPDDIDQDQIAVFVDELTEIDHETDTRTTTLATLLARCATVHAAGTHLAENADWNLLAIYFDTIDLTCHSFMELRPPKLDRVSEEDVRRYGRVIDEMYCFHDMMLGRYMQLVGDDVAIMVISDHGFLSEDARPVVSADTQSGRPVAWHREHGMFAVRGAGIKQDQLIFGAGLLDITPTVLAILGLKSADDMDGRVLAQIFDHPPSAETIESYEDIAREAAPDAEDDDDDPWAAQEAIRQLVELGYIDEPDKDAAKAVRSATRSKNANLAEVLIGAGRHAEAVPVLEEMLANTAKDTGVRFKLARACLQSGQLERCAEIAAGLKADFPNSPDTLMLTGQVALDTGDDEAALAAFHAAEQLAREKPGVWLMMAQIHLRRNRWDEAERLYRQCLEYDPADYFALHGLGTALLGQEKAEEAIEPLMRSAALRFDRQFVHLHLGQALMATGRIDGAVGAFQNALKVQPDMPGAHVALAMIFQQRGEIGPAAMHRSKAKLVRADKAAERAALDPAAPDPVAP